MASELPLVSREQAFLETYFQCLSQFAYDKAKDLSEKERESQKSINTGPLWVQLLASLTHLAIAEKSYAGLMFLGPKWFSRKENLRTSYGSLLGELRQIEVSGSKPDKDRDTMDSSLTHLISHLCGQLAHFLTARSKSMEFYEQMATMGNMRVMNYDDLLNVITHIIQTHQKNFHHPILAPLKHSFSVECDIITHLLTAQLEMSQCDFLSSLLHLNEAHTKLTDWTPLVPVKEVKKTLGFGSSTKNPSNPALYQWLSKYKATLVSKFSLYFHDVLNKQPGKQSAAMDMKTITAKASIDFYGKIVTFHKKSDVFNVSIILDVNGLEGIYKGPGYHHPDRIMESPRGLDSYPAVFSYPNERPLSHWPNVLMIMNEKSADLNTFDKIVWFYDKHVNSTYFMTRIEPRMTFAVIFDTKKAERDSYIVNTITDICSNLRCTKCFATLKPGSK
ncbi:unnamed protein product [Owenia fusiformis]|uniref:KICSTOR subunit 2 n=1 Tax=Owenia fusiformis TaxID=6347 RepID=A0A8J1UWV7_OWEFU|nr:unnamed protein product [Owenia fusiformis]